MATFGRRLGKFEIRRFKVLTYNKLKIRTFIIQQAKHCINITTNEIIPEVLIVKGTQVSLIIHECKFVSELGSFAMLLCDKS